MSYTPHEWDTGEVITAEKLNHIEQGIAGADYDVILHDDGDEVVIVKGTFASTQAAIKNLQPLKLLCYRTNADDNGGSSVMLLPCISMWADDFNDEMFLLFMVLDDGSMNEWYLFWAPDQIHWD